MICFLVHPNCLVNEYFNILLHLPHEDLIVTGAQIFLSSVERLSIFMEILNTGQSLKNVFSSGI